MKARFLRNPLISILINILFATYIYGAEGEHSSYNPDIFGIEEREDKEQKQGPTLFGVLHNTHLNIFIDAITEYTSKGLLINHTSFQNSASLECDHPFIHRWHAKLYFSFFTNLPANGEPSEVDYTIGNKFVFFQLYGRDTIIDAGYTHYSYTHLNDPMGALNPYNRSNEIYLGFNFDFNILASLYLYYDFNLEQFNPEATIAYKVKLNKLICPIPECFSISGTLGFGWDEAQRFNGDQHPSSIPDQHNSYIYGYFTGSLIWKLNDVAQLITGFTYTVNNDGFNNLGGHERIISWNILKLSLEY